MCVFSQTTSTLDLFRLRLYNTYDIIFPLGSSFNQMHQLVLRLGKTNIRTETSNKVAATSSLREERFRALDNDNGYTVISFLCRWMNIAPGCVLFACYYSISRAVSRNHAFVLNTALTIYQYIKLIEKINRNVTLEYRYYLWCRGMEWGCCLNRVGKDPKFDNCKIKSYSN